MFWKKSIRTKMLISILLPIVLVFVAAAIIILAEVDASLSAITTSELTAKSESASFQVSEFFTQYITVVEQMAANDQLTSMMREMGKGQSATDTASYAGAARTMDNILAGDPQNLQLVWGADWDSGQSVRSGGVIRGLPDYDITTRSWYTEMNEKNSVFITEPYEDSTTGALVASVLAPINENNNMMGAAAIDITVTRLGEMMAAYKLGQTGYFMLCTADGTLIYHPNPELQGKPVAESGMSENIISAIQNKQAGNYTYTNDGVEAHGYISMVGTTGWCVVAGLPTAEFSAATTAMCIQIIVIFAVGLLIILMAIILISQSIVRPMKKLSRAANQIAEGDLDVLIDTRSKDETGQVADAIGRTVTRLRDYIVYIDEISDVLNQIAGGNLDFTLQHTYAGEFSKVKDALLNISTLLNGTLSQIGQAADQVSVGSGQVSSGAQALSQGATEQASSMEELAATVLDISRQVKDNAGNASEANKKVAIVSSDLEESNRNMQSMKTAMMDINTNSAEIGKIIKTIEDIAFQTNILALNAAVEAARAGAAGKGFAVVADEVRNLASKSAEAAKNTTGLIENAMRAVDSGMMIVDQTADSLAGVVGRAHDVATAVDLISAASDNQAQSIEQVTQGMEQISSVVQTNSATAEQSAAASEELSSQAQMLKDLVGGFRLK